MNGRYFNAELLERIEGAARARPEMSRTQLSRLVCRWLDWRDPQGGVLGCSLEALGGVELLPVGPRRSGSYETWK
ncbi:MAG: hypothetical protein HYV63_25450 [Candidatus Schekmanbacteria bacterium]|nr:hypothetical protein [Candidatus Schekmanbacteria bacterium]